MPDWLLPLLNSPVAGGVVSGLLFLGGVKAELRRLDERSGVAMVSADRANERIDDHLKQHVKP